MKEPTAVKRYALIHNGRPRPRPNEGVRKLRLLRMEAIVESEHAREPARPPAP